MTPPAGGPVTVGRIVAAHGTAGEVRVLPTTDFPQRFASGARLTLAVAENRRTVVIRGARPHRGGLVLMRLEGVTTRTEAEALRGATLEVDRSQRWPLPPDHFYASDILGLKVVTESGEDLGAVAEVIRTPANDAYRVEGPAGEILIPALKAVVCAVDLEAGRMVVRPPGGLLDPEDENVDR